MKVQARELNHVALHVRDVAKSVHFYGEVLGLQALERPAFSFPGAWFALGTQELHLIGDPMRDPETAPTYHFAVLTSNIAEIWEELNALGISNVTAPAPRPDGALQVFFLDPDGHMIELLEFV